jgi:hypothetical protein
MAALSQWAKRLGQVFAPALLALLILSVIPADATDLRGRVDGRNRYSPYPFPVNGARVELYVRTGGRWQPIYNTFTGPDGMYYMRNIRPGNNYVLNVNGQNYPLSVFPSPYQDIPPIIISY